jgi:hypothetical protein
MDCAAWAAPKGEIMERAGAIQFEREEEGALAIVLVVSGEPVARSRSPANIAFEVAARDLTSLEFNEALRVPIPTDSNTLQALAQAANDTEEIFTVFRLVAECAW